MFRDYLMYLNKGMLFLLSHRVSNEGREKRSLLVPCASIFTINLLMMLFGVPFLADSQ